MRHWATASLRTWKDALEVPCRPGTRGRFAQAEHAERQQSHCAEAKPEPGRENRKRIGQEHHEQGGPQGSAESPVAAHLGEHENGRNHRQAAQRGNREAGQSRIAQGRQERNPGCRMTRPNPCGEALDKTAQSGTRKPGEPGHHTHVQTRYSEQVRRARSSQGLPVSIGQQMPRSGRQGDDIGQAGIALKPTPQSFHEARPGTEQPGARFAACQAHRRQFIAHIARCAQVFAERPLFEIETARVEQSFGGAHAQLETPGFAGPGRLPAFVPGHQDALEPRPRIRAIADPDPKTAGSVRGPRKIVDYPGYDPVHPSGGVRHALLQARPGQQQRHGGAQQQNAHEATAYCQETQRGRRQKAGEKGGIGRRRKDQEGQADAGQPCHAQPQHQQPGTVFSCPLRPADRRAGRGSGPCAERACGHGSPPPAPSRCHGSA